MGIWDKFILWLYRKELDDSYIDEHAGESTPEGIIKRVKLLFKLHGVEEAEIPEIYPEITLPDLQTDSLLLQKLTPDFLKKLSDFFQIRIEWLRSGEPCLFETRGWYKDQTVNFFEDLKSADFARDYNPFEIVTTKDKFNIQDPEHQPFILVIRVPVGYIDGRVIYRYMMESEWHWHHAPCRLGAKAIATRYYQLTHRMIPIYTVSKDNFKKLSAQLVTPYFDKKRNHEVSFEEYGALRFPHLEPYENHEYEAVIQELKDRRLDSCSYDYLSPGNSKGVEDIALDESGVIESHFKKAALASHEKTYQLKRECILFWLALPKPIKNREAARQFIKSVPEERIKTLAPTNRTIVLADAISEYIRKDEILAKKGVLPNWMKDFNPN